jgi:Na+/proline symporter
MLGQAGAVLILIMLFMAIVSTGSAESIAVSSLVAYDIYREYINPEATGAQILFVSRVVVVGFGLVMGALSILLFEIGLNLGWVYLFMGVVIGSAVAPLWNLMTWSKASGTGAVIAAWAGFFLAIIGWLVGAQIQSGEITVASLGTNEVMLSGNLIAIISSAIIHYVWSAFIDPQDYDFSTLDSNITLVEQDLRGLTDAEKDVHLLQKADRWIKRRGYVLTFVLIIVWPLLSVPAGLFSKSYFAFWVLVAIAWGFGAALVITVLPLVESADEINMFLGGIFNAITGKNPPERPDLTSQEAADKAIDDDAPAKEIDTPAAEVPVDVEEA